MTPVIFGAAPQWLLSHIVDLDAIPSTWSPFRGELVSNARPERTMKLADAVRRTMGSTAIFTRGQWWLGKLRRKFCGTLINRKTCRNYVLYVLFVLPKVRRRSPPFRSESRSRGLIYLLLCRLRAKCIAERFIAIYRWRISNFPAQALNVNEYRYACISRDHESDHGSQRYISNRSISLYLFNNNSVNMHRRARW